MKVYAVGVEYAHAEARKSPVVDGKVMRNARGREVRYPVILSTAEKEIARQVVLAFGQTLCGFDLLRSNGKSYVCDVNGWSFVKDSHKFWQDSANLFRQYCLGTLIPHHLAAFPQPSSNLLGSPMYGPSSGDHPYEHHGGMASVEQMYQSGVGSSKHSTDALPMSTPSAFTLPKGIAEPPEEAEGELLCVVAFTRHGDRTPKQKLKFTTKEPSILSMLVEHSDIEKREELKIKNIRVCGELRARKSRGWPSSDLGIVSPPCQAPSPCPPECTRTLLSPLPRSRPRPRPPT